MSEKKQEKPYRKITVDDRARMIARIDVLIQRSRGERRAELIRVSNNLKAVQKWRCGTIQPEASFQDNLSFYPERYCRNIG